mmetsp:Transcript_20287/g.30162  ORF Transcript_20287/g.30162 Transcript_20287/m.30162 type:complete len:132 (-) Transcript_20287:1601-1996(-)
MLVRMTILIVPLSSLQATSHSLYESSLFYSRTQCIQKLDSGMTQPQRHLVFGFGREECDKPCQSAQSTIKTQYRQAFPHQRRLNISSTQCMMYGTPKHCLNIPNKTVIQTYLLFMDPTNHCDKPISLVLAY